MEADNNCADSFVDSSDHLRIEIDRLREDNADLRASALMWKALYEAATAEASDNVAGTLARHPGRQPLPVEISVNVTGDELSRREKSPSSVAHVVS